MIIDDKNLFKPVTTCANLSQQVRNLCERMWWSQDSTLHIIKIKKKISTLPLHSNSSQPVYVTSAETTDRVYRTDNHSKIPGQVKMLCCL